MQEKKRSEKEDGRGMVKEVEGECNLEGSESSDVGDSGGSGVFSSPFFV